MVNLHSLFVIIIADLTQQMQDLVAECSVAE